MSGRRSTTVVAGFLKDLFPVCCHERIFLAGGTVRDLLIGRDCQDIDLVVSLKPEELISLGFRLVETTSSANIYFKYHPLFGKLETTIIDRMTELESNLRHRDFTVNAMAMDLSGVLYDPLGGLLDLERRVLRACSENSFSADPLRVFRAFRFEADGWCLEPATADLLPNENLTASLSEIPVERFSNEMLKALALQQPERFFQRMVEFNVGAAFLPELFRMPNIPAGPLQHHPEGDLFSHSIEVLQRVAASSGNPLARFCGFFHDIGKLATNPELYPKHHGHDRAGFTMAIDLCKRLSLPSAYRNALAWVSSLHGKASLWETLRGSTRLTMAERAVKAGIVEILPLVAAADKGESRPMPWWDDVVRVSGMGAQELAIDLKKLETITPAKRASFICDKQQQVLKKLLAQRNVTSDS